MRSCIITAVLCLTLVACGSRVQQLESAGEKIKQCVNQCSFAVTPVNENKDKLPNASVSKDGTVSQLPQAAAGDRIQTIWNSRLNLW